MQNFIITKKSLFSIIFVFLIMPSFVYGQYYIIENIPSTGDDDLRPEVNVTEPVDTGSQVIEDVITTDITTTIAEETETTVIETIAENKRTFQTAGLIGAVSGAVIAMATTAVPLFATTPTMIQDLMFLNLFGLFARRKNEKRWGVVFDVDTKLPIPAAKVILFDSVLKELETTYSDKDGRFGFLAGEGVYKLDIYKKDYEAFVDSDRDNIYGTLYVGNEVRIVGDEVLSVNVALRSLTINWAEYADKKIKQYTSTWSLVKKYLFTTFYFIGLIATIIITIFYPSIFNIILVIINGIFFVMIYFHHKKDHGTVMSNNKKPVPFAVVNLYDEQGKKDAFAVTDVIGRYYMLADNGNYTMKAVGQPVGGDKKEVHNDVHVRDQIVSKDIIFE